MAGPRAGAGGTANTAASRHPARAGAHADSRSAVRRPRARRKSASPADKDESGRITLAELVEPRRKPSAKLDVKGDGKLSFEDWAVKTIDQFEGADSDKNRALTPAEFATTAPKLKKARPACSCG